MVIQRHQNNIKLSNWPLKNSVDYKNWRIILRIIHKKPTIIELLDEVIKQSIKPIESIKLDESELRQFCDITGYAFSKQCGYTYKHYKITYDWESQR